MIQTGFQIVGERFHRQWIQPLILLQYFTDYYQPHHLHRNPKYRIDVRLDLYNYLHRKLHHIISHLMKQTPLSQSPRPDLLNRSNQSMSSAGGNQQRNIRPSLYVGPKQFYLLFIRLLIAQRQMKRNPMSLLGKPPKSIFEKYITANHFTLNFYQ